MKLLRWKIAASAVLLGVAASLAGCDRDKNKNDEPFSYIGTWATVKVMNSNISTDAESNKYVETITLLVNSFLDQQTISNVDEIKTFAKEVLVSSVEFARGIRIDVRDANQACNVSFAGLSSGVNGSWQAQDGTIRLYLQVIPAATLEQLKTDGSTKGKINYAFASSISGKTITLARKDNGQNLEWTLDSQVLANAFAKIGEPKGLKLDPTLLTMLAGEKKFRIEFHKVN